MKKKVLALTILSFSLGLLGAESSLGYFTGLAFNNTILYGDESWDSLDQYNTLIGISYSDVLDEERNYSRRIRFAYDLPLWARINRLNGTSETLYMITGEQGVGFNLFAGVEIPMRPRRARFDVTWQAGPVVDFHTFSDNLIITLGLEGGLETQIAMGEHFYTGIGITAHYYFWGLHTVGEAGKYNDYIKRGYGFLFYPSLGFRY